MSADKLHEVLIKKIDDIAQEQRTQREENRQEHRDIKSNIAEVSKKQNEHHERIYSVELKLRIQQTGLYGISAAIGAAVWKVPALITWIKTHIL